MAQIKNIKKPGDLIRGADVGLAALDKDGNVIGYKAAAADAGKVLTVGEDGSVAPAEGPSASLTTHIVDMVFTYNGNEFYVRITALLEEKTAFSSYSDFVNYLLNNNIISSSDNVNIVSRAPFFMSSSESFGFCFPYSIKFGNNINRPDFTNVVATFTYSTGKFSDYYFNTFSAIFSSFKDIVSGV